MATVITNLLSAIPWIGNDFVEFVFPSYITGLSYFIGDNLEIISNILDILMIVFSLGTIGIIRIKALRGAKERSAEDKSYALNIPYDFLAAFVGLVDGDGYIAITKSGVYIRIDLVISLDIRELEMLNYIHSILRVGRVNIYPASNTVKYTISRTDLQEIIFPLLMHHNIYFLTINRINQFNLAYYILTNNILYFADIPAVVPNVYVLPLTAADYVSLPFFLNWIVGFTIAEGSFFIKANLDACFSLRQKEASGAHLSLFLAFLIVFNTTRKIESRDGHLSFVVSSKKDIQTVVNFFSFTGLTPLMGHKFSQYTGWIGALKQSSRYQGLNLPN